MKKLVLVFNFEKETKNTVRFQEETEDNAVVAIGPLYVQKSALGTPVPSKLDVTITPAK